MIPFLGPGIANMAMIDSLPLMNNSNNSCFKHLLEYGYYHYQLVGKKSQHIQMTKENICIRAKQEGFLQVIEITENDAGDIVTITHECSDSD